MCKLILNLNFTYPRSKVIKKLPSASVNPENQCKKSFLSEELISDFFSASASLQKLFLENPILFLIPDT